MSAFQTFWQGLDWSVLTDILLAIIPSLLCITLHELAHGYVAYRLGDTTAKDAGRLTLNPLRHIDPMGLLMMIAFRFGWAKPVPVDMRNFEHPRSGMALTAAAGPLCNLILSVALMFLYGILYWFLLPRAETGSNAAWVALQTVLTTAQLSLYLAVFNILPISPLDGSKVLFAFLNDEWYLRLMRYERYGMILLFIVVATGILRTPLASATNWVFDKLYFFAQAGLDLARLVFP